jgi:endoglucanase
MDVLELLKELSETPAPSGFESRAAEVVKRWWEPLVDHLTVDRIGSLVALKKGQGQEPRPRLMLAAHMDEIGLMVKDIVAYPDNDDGNGFLKVTQIGGVDIRHLYGQMVVVQGSKQEPRELIGLLGSLPGKMLPESKQNKPFGYEELVVDSGLPAADLKKWVVVGDVISFRQPLRELLNDRVSGKALDNRASVAAVAVCLEYLQGRHHDWDVVAVATAQEETALLGAFTSAYAENPDAAIAIDVTFGKGPGATDQRTFELDGGPTLGLGPNVHPGIFLGLKEAAKALEMKVHTDPHSRYSGTDAYGLQIAREGIPTGLVSIPLRYMHTMVETIALADVKRAGRLLGEFIARLDEDFLDKIAKEMMEE